MAEVERLKQEIKQLKYENRSLHVLANNYSSGMKRKFDELQESEGQIQNDRQRFSAFLQRHIFPGSSSVWPSIEASNALSPMPPAPMPSAPMPSTPMPSAPRVLPSSGASSKQPL